MIKRIKTLTLRIDTSRRLSFRFAGKPMEGYAGDSVATAILSNGQHILSRSFKYHRPRGLFSMNGESSCSAVQIDKLPNVRAELTALAAGMEVKPQNVTGSVNFDLMAVTERFSKYLTPGFYYKNFHKPYWLWPFFQERIRKAAGVGKMNEDWQPGTYDNLYLNSDVGVIGGGKAGLNAAITAADQGLGVVLMEARPWLGGVDDWRTSATAEGKQRYQAIRNLADQVSAHEKIQIFTNTPLTGLYHDNLVTAFQRGNDADHFTEQCIELRCKSLIVATGCAERPLVFENNERPGVMTAECAHRLLMHYGIKPGEKVVFSTGHDLAVETAEVLHDHGVEIVGFADSRQSLAPELKERIRKIGVPLFEGWVAAKALGKKHIQGLVLCTLYGREQKTLACDCLIASAGTHPVIGPLLLTREKPAYDQKEGVFLAKKLPLGIFTAGEVAGISGESGIIQSGILAGLKAAANCQVPVEDRVRQAEKDLRKLYRVRTDTRLIASPNTAGKSFICFDEDVTVEAVDLTIQEGFEAIELAKRYSTAGMGPSQSGIPGINLPLIMSKQLDMQPGDIQPTVIRPPLYPTLLATYVGRDFKVEKRTPLHEIQQQYDPEFIWAGSWRRVHHFGADHSAKAEIDAVHNDVGIIDVSTLGKFRIYGKDALKALQYLYVSDVAKVKKDKLKYVAQCNQDGCLVDDGLITQVGENDYYFTTSSARAPETVAWFRYWTRDKDWDFEIINLTDAIGAFGVAGPQSRAVLQELTDANISNEALPYMGYKEVILENKIPVRLLRIGFLGELGYEIHAPASYLTAIWNLMMSAGRSVNITPIGLEALNVLRLEKGHVIVGLDSEYQHTLCDVGLGVLWDRKKKDHEAVGIAALRHTEKQAGRSKLVGFEMENSNEIPPDFSIVIEDTIKGHVTCVRYSKALGKAIGLAFVDDQSSEIGTPLKIYYSGSEEETFNARVVKPPFYDPGSERLRA